MIIVVNAWSFVIFFSIQILPGLFPIEFITLIKLHFMPILKLIKFT